ncbi:hypothetical protein [Desulfocurvibacter africanus]|uniref:hypothetical protein n=1 Tax=Desulfocurvibacter africanus TaxID=873 RepID=UPI0004864CDE|nr:hypothetical protein [Desulfocurvibacter africanus]
MAKNGMPPGFGEALSFPLVQALLGRRSRRFPLGAEIPDGPLAYKSGHEPMPLSDLETMLVVTAVGGNTGWHNLIYRHKLYAPHLSNYAGAAGGRTFPSGAGFHTSEIFFTDDSGLFFLPTRDAPALAEKDEDGSLDLEDLLAAHKSRVRKLADARMILPPRPPYFEGHNTWVANRPGTLLVIPVADLAQHTIANLCYYLQNGQVIHDDLHKRSVPGLERFANLADLKETLPLSFLDQMTMAEATVEISTACYAGALMLQAMGLGGWMFNGLNPFAVLGASGEAEAPGLGFRFDADPRWPMPNPTGLMGVMEGFCPPHYPDMRAAVEAFCERKFGPGGPYNPDTPGPFRDTPRVRGSAQVHDKAFRECVALQAQYVLDTFGRFPATVPSMYCHMYLQAHHLELEFYDTHFKPGAYLETHRRHMERWHGKA